MALKKPLDEGVFGEWCGELSKEHDRYAGSEIVQWQTSRRGVLLGCLMPPLFSYDRNVLAIMYVSMAVAAHEHHATLYNALPRTSYLHPYACIYS